VVTFTRQPWAGAASVAGGGAAPTPPVHELPAASPRTTAVRLPRSTAAAVCAQAHARTLCRPSHSLTYHANGCALVGGGGGLCLELALLHQGLHAQQHEAQGQALQQAGGQARAG
jgi:hypothetical protein